MSILEIEALQAIIVIVCGASLAMLYIELKKRISE